MLPLGFVFFFVKLDFFLRATGGHPWPLLASEESLGLTRAQLQVHSSSPKAMDFSIRGFPFPWQSLEQNPHIQHRSGCDHCREGRNTTNAWFFMRCILFILDEFFLSHALEFFPLPFYSLPLVVLPLEAICAFLGKLYEVWEDYPTASAGWPDKTSHIHFVSQAVHSKALTKIVMGGKRESRLWCK